MQAVIDAESLSDLLIIRKACESIPTLQFAFSRRRILVFFYCTDSTGATASNFYWCKDVQEAMKHKKEMEEDLCYRHHISKNASGTITCKLYYATDNTSEIRLIPFPTSTSTYQID